jgi:hypothetical protein
MALTAGAAPAASGATFNKDIAPLLMKHCARCHRPGEIGPFSLLTYKDAVKRAQHLKEITALRRMPPWKPEPEFGDFLDSRRMSASEIELLASWVDAGAPEGDALDLPPIPKFTRGWQLGKPDLVLKMPESFAIPEGGSDAFRCFVIPSGLNEDKIVSALEFRPDSRAVVHHANVYLDNKGKARELNAAGGGLGYPAFGGPGFQAICRLGGWAPGATPRFLPDGVGRLMPKNCDVVVNIHYHPNGKPENDQSSVGIFFSDVPSTKRILSLTLAGNTIDIPPGEKRHRIVVSVTLPANVHAISAAPHMHFIGHEMKVTAKLPSGETKPMIWIKDWDANWQGQYFYREPVPLPRGTVLELEAFYDNSADNPQNPNKPPNRVELGWTVADEMCKCTFMLLPDRPQGYRPLQQELKRLNELRVAAEEKSAMKK